VFLNQNCCKDTSFHRFAKYFFTFLRVKMKKIANAESTGKCNMMKLTHHKQKIVPICFCGRLALLLLTIRFAKEQETFAN